jgi:hypothetical protein
LFDRSGQPLDPRPKPLLVGRSYFDTHNVDRVAPQGPRPVPQSKDKGKADDSEGDGKAPEAGNGVGGVKAAEAGNGVGGVKAPEKRNVVSGAKASKAGNLRLAPMAKP